MKALEYEYLMRAALSCERTYENGADADIYRRMERAFLVIDDPMWGSSKSDKEYEFQKQFAGVRRYVSEAIQEGMKKIHCTIEEKKRIRGYD